MDLPAAQIRAVVPPTRRGLSRVEAAGYIGISPSTFDKLVEEGKMPSPKRISTRKIWDVRALDGAFDALDSDISDSPNSWDDA